MKDKTIVTISWISGGLLLNILFEILEIKASRLIPSFIGVIIGTIIGKIICKVRR